MSNPEENDDELQSLLQDAQRLLGALPPPSEAELLYNQAQSLFGEPPEPPKKKPRSSENPLGAGLASPSRLGPDRPVPPPSAPGSSGDRSTPPPGDRTLPPPAALGSPADGSARPGSPADRNAPTSAPGSPADRSTPPLADRTLPAAPSPLAAPGSSGDRSAPPAAPGPYGDRSIPPPNANRALPPAAPGRIAPPTAPGPYGDRSNPPAPNRALPPAAPGSSGDRHLPPPATPDGRPGTVPPADQAYAAPKTRIIPAHIKGAGGTTTRRFEAGDDWVRPKSPWEKDPPLPPEKPETKPLSERPAVPRRVTAVPLIDRLPIPWRKRPPRCSSASLNVFTRQLSSLLGAGIPINQALGSLSIPRGERLYTEVAPELAAQVQSGRTLSNCMARFPGIFPMTYVALVKAAEQSGQLVATLDRIDSWLEGTGKLVRKLQSAMTYPLFVLALSAVLTFILFRTVIPGILDTVKGLGVEFPWPTLILATVVDAAGQPWVWILLALISWGVIAYLSSPEGMETALVRLHRTAAVVPVIKPIFLNSSAARYAATLSMLLSGGVDLLESAALAAETSGSLLLREDSRRVALLLREGKSLSQALARQPGYPTILWNLVQVGEEVGQVHSLLEKAHEILDEDTGYRLERLAALLEPIILAGLSLLVGCVLVATIMPLAQLAASL